MGIDDYVIDVSVPANRQDCNSVLRSFARDCRGVRKNLPQSLTFRFSENDVDTKDLVNVRVLATDICKGYYMQGLTDVKIEKSPLWLTCRLAKVGLHGINNIVDITNYVLFEIGQPMHAFDYKDILDKTIVVRRADDGEKLFLWMGKNTF